MKRYYFSPVVVGKDIDGHNEVKVKVADYPVQGYVADIPSDPNTGLPLKDFAIVCVTGTPAQHAAILADASIQPLPHNDNFDQEIVIPTKFRDALSAKQISISSRASVRENVTTIGKKANPNFEFERFFISE